MSEFDPYVDWLKIDPALCPPNYYDLLGVMPFENDRRIIEKAFESRLVHVRSFQTGPRGIYTQDLLNELAQARLCLLNEASRQAYDDALRQGKSKPPVDIENMVGAAVPPIDENPIKPPESKLNNSGSSSKNPFGGRNSIIYAVACIAIVVAVWGWVKWSRNSNLASAKDASSNEEENEKNKSKPIKPEKKIINKVEVDKGILPGANNSFMFSPTNVTLDKPHPSIIDTSDGQLLDQWQPVKSKARWKFWINTPGHYEAIVSYNATTNESFSRFVVQADDDFRKSVKMRTAEKMDFFFEEEVVILFRKKGGHHIDFFVEGVPGNFRLKSITLRPNIVVKTNETEPDEGTNLLDGIQPLKPTTNLPRFPSKQQ